MKQCIFIIVLLSCINYGWSEDSAWSTPDSFEVVRLGLRDQIYLTGPGKIRMEYHAGLLNEEQRWELYRLYSHEEASGHNPGVIIIPGYISFVQKDYAGGLLSCALFGTGVYLWIRGFRELSDPLTDGSGHLLGGVALIVGYIANNVVSPLVYGRVHNRKLKEMLWIEPEGYSGISLGLRFGF